MTSIDLIDRTIHEAPPTERRAARTSQFWRKATAQKLLSMLERGPLASTSLE
jgi:hypothetical protein